MNTDYEKEALTHAKQAKESVKFIRSLSTQKKNAVLKRFSQLLESHAQSIIVENKKDMENGKSKGLSQALLDRLLLDEKRILSMKKSVEDIVSLPDPIGEVVRGVQLPNGLELITKRVPIGVIMTIFESRPNVIVDIASLSFKSGNACILRGGSEAFHSNLILSGLFHEALIAEGLSSDCVVFVKSTDREAMLPYFQLDQLIDIIVPRGGEALIQFVSKNSKVPVVKHDKGVTNLFIDASAKEGIVLPILLNSKMQRPGVCNALENLFIHRDYPDISSLLEALAANDVKLLLDEKSLPFYPKANKASEEDFYLEFLDNRLSVKIVENLEEAIQNIERYSSGHTECILSESQSNILEFQSRLDSASIFVNCSTRFHDGGEYGLGAEVGISTGKLHVRGPMGLIHLTTTTTFVTGNGQTRV
ncbi:gamma-glutamyl phosphate reductase [Leptospira ryugenii]|uniref:Gamma-glutamyl phosphate reductase n=1 Tax=Leptospira ryugenii TaxID=1917863 RepID=A0A2P2DX12_9LEPT|nr:glutamate-5-semialdehyde dehydrogenase [Leptospira ryugenii]GBF49167.1 gamma-glutamyl phosphate reductase [Leptospira ryugenii]